MNFSLVAGACCFINFTHGGGGKSNEFPQKVTLNINSTGAKYITSSFYIFNEGRRLQTFDTDVISNYIDPRPQDLAQCIWIYNGTRYILHGVSGIYSRGVGNTYNDYSD